MKSQNIIENKEARNWSKGRKGKAAGFALAKLLSFGVPASLPFILTSCDPDPGIDVPAKPIEITINIPAELTHLSPGAKITVVFPANFNATRLDAIRGKLVEAVEGLAACRA